MGVDVEQANGNANQITTDHIGGQRAERQGYE